MESLQYCAMCSGSEIRRDVTNISPTAHGAILESSILLFDYNLCIFEKNETCFYILKELAIMEACFLS